MRRSRIVIAATSAVALVALGFYIVRFGPLAPAPSSTPGPVGTVQAATPAVVEPTSPSSSAAAVPSAPTSSTRPPAPVSPSASAPTGVPSPSPGRHPIDVVLTYVDWSASTGVVEAGAYAAVVENAGLCTLTLTSGGSSVTTSVAALTNASTMSCGGLTVPRDRLASGSWTAVIKYESATSVGSSAPAKVVVP
ncbi:hypothetical protein GALL_246850 [mine drainage metagenome]|uniref:Uncharacterized protein n=1 Tax=mine drainage metagenome TaxID=410659 RepID=A0A1J5RV64_9ZZZZ